MVRSAQTHTLDCALYNRDENVKFFDPAGLRIQADMHEELHVPGDGKWMIMLDHIDEPQVRRWVFLSIHSLFPCVPT